MIWHSAYVEQQHVWLQGHDVESEFTWHIDGRTSDPAVQCEAMTHRRKREWDPEEAVPCGHTSMVQMRTVFYPEHSVVYPAAWLSLCSIHYNMHRSNTRVLLNPKVAGGLSS